MSTTKKTSKKRTTSKKSSKPKSKQQTVSKKVEQRSSEKPELDEADLKALEAALEVDVGDYTVVAHKGEFHVALIGAGRIGYLFGKDPKRSKPASLAEAFNETPFAITAVCDTNPEIVADCQESMNIKKGYVTHTDMLSDYEAGGVAIDLAIIATPTPSHHAITMACLEAGVKYILCEKPLASSLKECDEIIREAEKRGALVMVNLTRRYLPPYHDLYNLLQTGDFGKLRSLLGIHPAPLMRSGVHLIDLLVWNGGKPKWVSATTVQYKNWLIEHYKGNDYSGSGVIKFEDGTTAFFDCSYPCDHILFRVEAWGEKGAIQVVQNNRYLAVARSTESPRYEKLKELDWQAPFASPGTPDLFYVAETVGKVLKGEALPCATAEDARAAMEVIVAWHASVANDGRPVILPIKPNQPAYEYKIDSH